MALSVEQFVKRLEDSGIIADETIRDYVPPNASPKDGEELARSLVRNKKLTKFQAETIWHGTGRCLILGNYILLEKIGADVMGTVYKAQHRWMNRLVAIKMFPQALVQHPAAVARLQRGFEAAAKLRHPNIVAADDADFYERVHFLVMEYVNGNDLSVLVEKDGPISVEAALNIVLQAAQGLAAAHAEGIVHGGITPAKLLMDKQGTIKILGLGLTTVNFAGIAATQPTDLAKTETFMETVNYMAPEQASDMDAAGARSDIYSLGCILFYLLTGKPVYDGDSSSARILAHQNQQIPSLRELRPEVSIPLEGVFGRMVAKKVDHRYQTMADAIANLERCRASGNNPP